MGDNSVTAYRHVNLDLSHLNQRAGRKKSSRSLSNHKDGGILQYGSDFNIQNTWVSSGKIDMLRESMLSYSKRMSDIRRIRGIQTLKQVPTPSLSTNSLWINMSKGSVEVNTLEHTEALMRKSFPPNMPGKVSRSLGTIKLEPLLGSQKAHNSMEIEKTSSLHTQKFEKERGYHTEQLKRSSQVGDEEPVKVKHITVTITIPPPEPEEEEEEELQEPEPPKKKLIPLGNGRARPRKAKRMKITRPALDSIDEDQDEPEMINTQESIEDEYNHLLSDVHKSHEVMLQQKRKTVALLRQTNYAQRSNQQNRQLAMASLAKRKLRKLPPIPTGRPSFRYTNSKNARDRSLFSDSYADGGYSNLEE